MGLASVNRRSHDRLEVAGDDRYRLEFDLPGSGGSSHRMQLNDLSHSGLSFIVDGSLPEIEVGMPIDGVTVHLGERAIRGDLVVIHVTQFNGADPICGALFYPGSDDDLRTLKETVGR